MTTNVQPAASLAPLVHPHGSATYTDQTSAWRARVLAAVNGPLDFHGRRDIRRADTAAADVLVKPGVGHALSGVKCRHLEAVVRGVIGEGLVRGFGMGRMGVVITLVVTAGETPERRGSAGRGGRVRVGSSLPLIPPLLHAATLALLHAAIPMSTFCVAALVAVVPPSPERADGEEDSNDEDDDKDDGEVMVDPTPAQLDAALSAHVFCFAAGVSGMAAEKKNNGSGDDGDDKGNENGGGSDDAEAVPNTGHGRLLLALSEGAFGLGVYERAFVAARRRCLGKNEGEGRLDGGSIVDGDSASLQEWLRGVVAGRVRAELAWRD